MQLCETIGRRLKEIEIEAISHALKKLSPKEYVLQNIHKLLPHIFSISKYKDDYGNCCIVFYSI